MKTLTLKAPAKINLGLSIVGKLSNNYHEIKTIYTQVSLFDFLRFEENDNGKIEIDCDEGKLSSEENNLVFEAANLIKRTSKVPKGIKIFLQKNIPIGSGLGGGSSDAAITLLGLNKIWNLQLSQGQLIKLALKIGADVAYQLTGGVKLENQGGRKAGEFLPLGIFPFCSIVICFPQIEIMSKQAFSCINYGLIGKNNLSALAEAILKKNLEDVAFNLHNDFELWTFESYPLIKKIKEDMLKHDALGSLMSGKGSAVFGIFANYKEAQKANVFLKKNFPKTFLVEPL